MTTSTKRINMPDVAEQTQAKVSGSLNRVGMSKVEIPVQIRNNQGQVRLLPAKGDFYVSLDRDEAKGIHMSRLFILAEKLLAEKELNAFTVDELLNEFLKSHEGLSEEASIKLNFDYMVKRPALITENEGWRYYKAAIGGKCKRDGDTHIEMSLRITYSSTCPCSSALARQLIQKKFIEDFESKETVYMAQMVEWLGKEESILATPHSQRSYADIILRFDSPESVPTFESVINAIEEALQTPVQAAVKREDEQEFARLNGSNPMFCEDAARRLKHAVENFNNLQDYRVEARHLESLHPHDAVAIVTKGIVGGLEA
jgi:GTP cyclohydrolase IB